MKKRTALIILYLVLLLIIGAFVTQVILGKAITSEIIIRTVIPLALCASAIAKVTVESGNRFRRTALYASSYREELKTAFTAPHQKKQYKQLMDAIGLYNRNQYADAVKKLKALLPYSIEFIPFVAPMTDSDYRFRQALDCQLKKNGAKSCDEMEEDLLETVCEKYHFEGHRIGGYPYFTQSDPREEHVEYRKYDTLLLQIDSHDENKVMIGDSGVMTFLIPHEKLKACDFSDVLYTWDCY